MTQYFTDFTEYADTAALAADWKKDQWDVATFFVLSLDATEGVGGGPAMLLENDPTFRRIGVKWLTVPDATDVEIVARFKKTGTGGFSDTTRIGLIGRGSGTSTATNTGFIGGYLRNNLQLSLYNSGSFSNIASTTAPTTATDTWYWTRYRANGTSHKSRTWADGATEPSTWDIDTTTATLNTSGFVGIFPVGNGADPIYVDRYGVGTGGDSAPTTDPSAGTDVSPYGKQSLKQSYQPIAASRLNGVMQ